MLAPSRRILIVEDDADVRLLLRVHLQTTTDWEVVAETDRAEDALALAEAHQPELILLDNQLAGGTTGAEIAPRLKACVGCCAIVMYSAAVSTGSELPGVDAVVSKSASLAHLETVMRDRLSLASAG